MNKSMRQTFGEALRDVGEIYKNLVVLDADVSSSTQTCIFAQAYPDRFYNFGISELDMVAAAAGMAASGEIPVVSSFAFLLALRAGDAVRSLVAYNGLNVKLAAGYAGLSDFADGASHQSIADLSIMRSLPNMTVLCPSDTESTRGAVRAMLDFYGPVYLRSSRAEVGSLHGGDEQFVIGKANVMRRGTDVTLCACGTVLEAALEASDLLAKQGITCQVLEYATIKPFDTQTLLESAEVTGHVVTVEENNILGGLGSAVAEILCEQGIAAKLRRIGLKDCFGESGAYGQLLAKHGLDTAGIIDAVKKLLK